MVNYRDKGLYIIVKLTHKKNSEIQQSALYIDSILHGTARQQYIDELKRLQSKHIDHGVKLRDDIIIMFYYERDMPKNYFKLHPEQKEDYYKYGDYFAEIFNVPLVWHVRVQIVKEHKDHNEVMTFGKFTQIT